MSSAAMDSAPFEGYREFIPDFSVFLDSLNRPFPTHLRVNRLKIDPETLSRLLEERGIEFKRADDIHECFYTLHGLHSPGKLREYFLGYFHPQALTSCLAPLILSPRPHSLVLDTCASPGGKTSQMADMMGNSGIIIANEFYWNRHAPLSNTLARLGVLNTVITAYQAQEFPLRTKFHYVLADVPCTGEGRFRMNGGKNWYEYHLRRALLPEIQKRIILRGFDLLEDLGEMVYSTCTYNPEENESVVDYLLQERNAVLLPLNTPLPHEPGLKQWRGRTYDQQLQRAARFYPHQLDSVGFFVARIGRKR